MTPYQKSMSLDDLQRVFQKREHLYRLIRTFFHDQEFLEVHTPIRIPTPALELHIDAEPSGTCFLRTSPELHMKRLLAAGFNRIYQLGPCFRHAEEGPLHHPEYTMLEWYCTHMNYMDILHETQALYAYILNEWEGPLPSDLQDSSSSMGAEWAIYTVDEVFIEFAGWSPIEDYDPNRFDLDLTEKVEPMLPKNRPVVLIDYPKECAAMASCSTTPPYIAERWELYLGGVEIANAYTELIELNEQFLRFLDCAKQRKDAGKPVYNIDTAFMRALSSGMPSAGGIALGVDRLLMLLMNKSSLDDVLPFRGEIDSTPSSYRTRC